MTFKTCSACKENKPVGDFYKRSEAGRNGYESACKSCKNHAATLRQKSNPEKHNEQVANWRRNNKERHLQNEAAWRKRNPEKIRIKASNRRAKKAEVGGHLSKDIAKKLFVMQKGRCACCGGLLGSDYHIDHIMPISLGGRNADENVQLLHSHCNLKKSAKHPVDFMQEQGFLL